VFDNNKKTKQDKTRANKQTRQDKRNRIKNKTVLSQGGFIGDGVDCISERKSNIHDLT
jgi:hypothetical protein